jgi:hypothetical protein
MYERALLALGGCPVVPDRAPVRPSAAAVALV